MLMTDQLPILFSPIEASKVLGVSRTTLYEQMKKGHLRSVKIGRSRKFTRDHMIEFINDLERAG